MPTSLPFSTLNRLLRGQSQRVERLADQSGELVHLRLVGFVEVASYGGTTLRLATENPT
jgi:hypothetical protein